MTPSGAEAAPRTRRQWVLLGTAAVTLAALCLVAGRWQWHRYVHREAQIAQIETNYAAAPTRLADVLAGGALTPDAEWRPVTLHGSYDVAGTVLLRNRPVGGQAGYHVLVPLRLDPGQVGTGGGDVIVVDRGFLPWPDGNPGTGDVPAPPGGDVSVTVTMRPAEPGSPRAAPAGQVRTIDPARVLAAGDIEGSAVAAYGQVRTEDPAAADTLGVLPAPDVDPGSHLSYTFQWCVFAAGALGGFVVLWRRERLERTGRALTAGDLLAARAGTGEQVREPGSWPGPAGATNPRRGGRRRRPTAEDEEDALIDAQLRARG